MERTNVEAFLNAELTKTCEVDSRYNCSYSCLAKACELSGGWMSSARMILSLLEDHPELLSEDLRGNCFVFLLAIGVI